MIQRDMLHKPAFNYIKKERFTGSIAGMRYALYKETRDEDNILMACIYPEPYCFEKTPEEKKSYKEFSFSNEGLEEALDWLSDQETSFDRG